MLLWIILFHAELMSSFVDGGSYRGASISCVCSTTQCLEHRLQYCNTTGMCFSQYLDREDGSHPVVRGCISSKTPLLCENRRPAVAAGSWPVLLCCSSDLCNRDAVPTPPPWATPRDNEDDPDRGDSNPDSSIQNVTRDAPFPEPGASNSSAFTPAGPAVRTRTLPHIVSPVYISVLVLGVFSLAVIGAVAAVVLRRNGRFYAEQYGALEGCPKHAPLDHTAVVLQCDCDSESVSQCSQPFVHVVYDRQPADDT